MNNKSLNTCINCGSSTISYYPKYYQCDECQRKYPFTSKQEKPIEIEKSKLTCGHMSIYNTHINIYNADILWEDIESISVKKIHIYKNTRIFIDLHIYNYEKYKKEFRTLSNILSISNNSIAVESFGSFFFTKGSQKIIMDFFKNLKKDFNEEESIKKIQLDQIEKTLNDFRGEGNFFRILILFILLLIIFT